MKLDNSVYYTPAKPFDAYNRNIQGKNSLAPEIMTEVFQIKEPHYNLGSDASRFKRENFKFTHYGIQSNMEYSTPKY